MLKDGTGFSRVIICCGRVDLRRGMDGLAAYVRLNYELDPFEKGVLYLFCGNQCDRIRGICFEGIGMECIPFGFPKATDSSGRGIVMKPD